MTALITKDTDEPLLTGTLNERFALAVHDEPALYYDVVQTGWADRNLRQENGFSKSDGKVAYEMVLLHGGMVTDALLGKMMALQEKVARYAGPHTDNVIAWKSEDEVINHYVEGGLGLGLLTSEGELIGQTMLGFPENEEGEKESAHISWLMVDRAFGGNMLCQGLITMAAKMAESAGLAKVTASVRTHNLKGIEKFSGMGFVAEGAGQHHFASDQSMHIKMCMPVGTKGLAYGEEAHPRPQPLASLMDPQRLSAFDDLLTQEGLVGVWSRSAKWFTVHAPAFAHAAKPAHTAEILQIVQPAAPEAAPAHVPLAMQALKI